jgi:hypothetical protein
MRVCFNLMHVFNGRPSDIDNSFVLRSLLDCLTQINQAFLERHRVPLLYQSGVFYKRTKVWEAIPALYRRGYGDCKSLACALAAEYLSKGIEAQAVFRWIKNGRGPEGGGRDYHILVYVPKKNGYENKLFEDPSKKLGMGQDETRYFR